VTQTLIQPPPAPPPMQHPPRQRLSSNALFGKLISLLELLGLITVQDGAKLETFIFVDSCPLYLAEEIDEAALDQHGFELVSRPERRDR
jgi:hypothetical protein